MNTRIIDLLDHHFSLRSKLSKKISSNMQSDTDLLHLTPEITNELSEVGKQIDELCNNDQGIVKLYHQLWLSLRKEQYEEAEITKHKIDALYRKSARDGHVDDIGC